MSNFASEGWRIVEIIVTVHRTVRGAPGLEEWKKPFKELKFSAVRAEREWALLLKVEVKETKTWEDIVGPTAAEA